MSEEMHSGMCSLDNSQVELSLDLGVFAFLIVLIMKHEGVIYLHVIIMICLVLHIPY